MARALIVNAFADRWSSIYDKQEFEEYKHLHPLGEIGHISSDGTLTFYKESI